MDILCSDNLKMRLHDSTGFRPFFIKRHFGNTKAIRAEFRSKGVIEREEFPKWNQLTRSQKVAGAAKATTNIGIVVLGVGIFGSSTKIFGEALDKIRANPECQRLLGSPIKGHGGPSHSPRQRNRRVSYQAVKNTDGTEHRLLHFYVEGPENDGVALLDMIKNEKGKWVYKYLIVDVAAQGLRGPKRLFVEYHGENTKDEVEGPKYDKSKLFFDYEATVGSVIAVMKKTAKISGSESGFKTVASRKKRKRGVLVEGVDNGRVAAKVPGVCSWSSETEDTTESESVDMEEECLVEETSFDYGESEALTGGDYDQMPTSSKVKTKKALGKPLGKIDFSKDGSDDGVLSDAPLELPLSMKNLVNVSVRKSFALDIGLDKVASKSSQEKLVVVRKLFSGINGFGEASTPSKFSGIIRATFTSKSNRAVVVKKIPVGTSAEAVRAALSEFEVIRAIKMQLIRLWQKVVVEFEQSDQADLIAAECSILIGKDAVRVAKTDSDKEAWDVRDQHRALLYTLPMGTNAHDIWDFVRSVGGKTCVIDHYSVTYARARCAVVCFDSAESLDAAVGTMPVLRNTNLRWSYLISARCAKCEKLGHMSLGCAVRGKLSSSSSLCRVFSDMDKSRLAIIYAKRSAPVACPVFFGGLSWAKVACRSFLLPLSGQNVVVTNGSSSEMKLSQPVTMEVNNRFAALERSLASLVEQVGKLAKRLDALGPMVSQPSSGCQPLVIPSSQDQGVDVVMSESSSVSTSGGNVAGAVSFDMSSVSKLENSMKCLMETVLGLSAKVNSLGALPVSLPLTQ
ncbi:hypothetical protein G9A89_005534 [Geosiphon pyriformis]|nr:hypothetical protein G9A89_005534 [Geosiphon pyriformis]